MTKGENDKAAPADVMELDLGDLKVDFGDLGFENTSELRPRPLASRQIRALNAMRALLNGDAQVLTLCMSSLIDSDATVRDLGEQLGCDDLRVVRSIRRKGLFGTAGQGGLINEKRELAFAATLFLEHPSWLLDLTQALLDHGDLKVIIYGSAADCSDLTLLWPELSQFMHADVRCEFDAASLPRLLGGIIADSRSRRGTCDFSADAVRLLAFFLMRASGDRHWTVIPELRLRRFIVECSTRALGALVNATDVFRVAAAWDLRDNYVAKAAMRDHLDRQILLDTSGTCVGQINGLSVIETAGTSYEYGEPVRITAAVRAGGDGDIVDVERKAELAGQIHAKAMMIISGFLGREFGGVLPLPASPSLVFEQSYSEIDGDSASLTGLCAVLSAFGELPLRQDLAVTGSCDQFGNVQAVGGVSQKIEGFFRVCAMRGLTGTQGVIIPSSCVSQLVLRPAVTRAIAQKRFHIYTVNHVQGAMELLSSCKWGGPEVEGSVVARVCNRMELISSRGESAPWWHFW